MPASERVCKWCGHQVYYDLDEDCWMSVNPDDQCVMKWFAHCPEVTHLIDEQSVMTGCCRVQLTEISDLDSFTFYPEETTCGKPPLP